MTRRHTIETERVAEDDDGEFIAASLAIEFNYTAPQSLLSKPPERHRP